MKRLTIGKLEVYKKVQNSVKEEIRKDETVFLKVTRSKITGEVPLA